MRICRWFTSGSLSVQDASGKVLTLWCMLAVGSLLPCIASGTAKAQGLAPLCGVPVFPAPGHPLVAQATFDGLGQPVILIDPVVHTLAGPDYERFVLAHECAHHLLGHLPALAQISMLGPYAVLAINPGVELEADCWAASELASQGDLAAVAAAANYFQLTQGPFTQPGYPSGHARAHNIAKCGGLIP